MSDCNRCGKPLGGPDDLHTCTPAVKTYSGGKPNYVEPEEKPRESGIQITHAEGCWSWGPAHYMCALEEIAKLKGYK